MRMAGCNSRLFRHLSRWPAAPIDSTLHVALLLRARFCRHMTRKIRTMVPDLSADPFRERSPPVLRERLQLLGGRFEFTSNSRELLGLVEWAYAGLPRHRLSAVMPRLRVTLLLTSGKRPHARSEPPPLEMFSGAGFLGGATDSSDFVALTPERGAALVTVSPRMLLRFPYHARYELIEFAVFTLAARSQGLVPLHAACVSRNGRAVLLMGASGSGKSTAALHSLLRGLDFVSEDSVFVVPDTLRATGLANFLHVRPDSLRWLARARDREAIRKSPVILRRSGVRKFEVDLRRGNYQLAASAPTIAAVVFMSAQNAGGHPLLTLLPKSGVPGRLAALQPYAAGQPHWTAFSRNLSGLDAFELRRGQHPLEAAETLGELLAPGHDRPYKLT